MNAIGIRQGRLSPPSVGPVPCFPEQSWKEEFARAKTCGFAFVDWLFAARDYDRNPVWTNTGHDEILERIARTGVRVESLCADYFIVHPFVRVAEEARHESVSVLNRLIGLVARVGVRVLVVPVLEAGEIRNAAEMSELRDSLDEPLALAETCQVRLALETDLPARDFRAVVERRPHAFLGACYDTGNAAARGFDVAADIATLGPYLSAVHIKDRRRNGVSVRPGEGDADLGTFFRVAAEVGYDGPSILEAPAGDDPVSLAIRDLAFLNKERARADAGRRLDHSVDR